MIPKSFQFVRTKFFWMAYCMYRWQYAFKRGMCSSPYKQQKQADLCYSVCSPFVKVLQTLVVFVCVVIYCAISLTYRKGNIRWFVFKFCETHVIFRSFNHYIYCVCVWLNLVVEWQILCFYVVNIFFVINKFLQQKLENYTKSTYNFYN